VNWLETIRWALFPGLVGMFICLVLWSSTRPPRGLVTLDDARALDGVLYLPDDLDLLPRERACGVMFDGFERKASWPGETHRRRLAVGRHYVAVLATDEGQSFAILRQQLARVGLQHRLVDGSYHVWVRFYLDGGQLLARHFFTSEATEDVLAALNAVEIPFVRE
jgi:hypothetical protein